MTSERFLALVAAYGADARRWPEAERDAARSDCRKETAHIEHCELKLHNAGLSIDDGLATAIDDLIAERDDWKERAKVPGRSSTKHLEEKP